MMQNHVLLAALSLFTLIAVLAYAAWEVFGVRRHQKRTGHAVVPDTARTESGETLFKREPEQETLAAGQDIGHR